MKNRKLIGTIVMVLVLLLATTAVFAEDFEYEMEREIAKKILISLQDEDLETFSTYCATEERMAKMINGMGENSPEEIGVKEELSQAGFADFRKRAIDGFKKAIELAKNDSLNIQKSIFPELAFYKTTFDLTGFKTIKVKADLSTDKYFMMTIDMFKTKDDIIIYGFDLVRGSVY